VRREARGGAIEILGKFFLFTFIVAGLICLPLGWDRWKQDAEAFRDLWR